MSGVSGRAVLVGIVMAAAVCVTVSWAELVLTEMQIGQLQFPPVVVGMFLIVLAGNALVRRVSARLALKPADLVVIYCMMLVATMVGSRGLMTRLIPALIAPDYYTTPENKWTQIFYPYIKPWMVPFDTKGEGKQPVSVAFYEGLREGEGVPWGQWITPLLAGSIFIAAVFGAFLCIASLLRQQWVDRERLSFPLAQVPLEMVRERTASAFFRNRLAWMGILIPVAVFSINGVHNIWPWLPSIALEKDLRAQLPAIRPWNEMSGLQTYFSMAAVGFFFLLPLDLVFSLWFFFLFTRVQDVVASLAGMTPDMMPLHPARVITGYQVMGAYLVLVAYLVKTSWPSLREALARRAREASAQELLPPRLACVGLVLCFGVAVGWCHAAGMSLSIAVLEMFVYIFVISLVVARAVAECGLLMTTASWRPLDMAALIGTRDTVGPANLTPLAFTEAVQVRDPRGLVLTGLMDSLRLADGVGIRRRALLPVLVGAIVLAAVVSGALQLWLPYSRAALNLYWFAYWGNPVWALQNHASLIQSGQVFDWRAPSFFMVGVCFTTFLAAMRAAFAWWPLHPLAYAVSPSWTMHVFWFPCMVAWAAKFVILRYGGMRLFARARPFFLGLVLGEFGMAVLWTLFSFIWRLHAPTFPWP